MDEEICVIERNGTWELTNLPPEKKPIGVVIDSFDSSDDDDENCLDTCENNSFISLDDNDGLESFTFDDNALSNENVDDLHDMLFDDMNIESSLCDLSDIECVTYHDNCLDDALYIHDLISKDRSEGVEKENVKEEVEDKKKTSDESVREEVEEKVRNDEKELGEKKKNEKRVLRKEYD
nr:hypothetical protein Iba_chr10dCG8590 [Ipomoea batatas]